MIKREWPLAVFTVAVQFACGLALAAIVVDFRGAPAEVAGFRPLGMAIFPVLAAGLLCSLFHLGRPLRAWRSLANLRQSRLTFEILITLMLAAAAAVYSAFWATGRDDARFALGLGTAIAGLTAVLAGARLYMVPTQPVWNCAWLPASFFGTTLLLGGFASAVFVPWDVEMRRIFLGAGLGGGLLLLVALVFMAKRVPRPAAPLLVPCVLLAGVLPAVVAFLWPVATVTPLLIAAFGLIVLGALLGRMFLYALMEATPRF